MSGSRKNALVTGGTDGVGKEVARGLARAGHRVILVGRDAEKGALVERERRSRPSLLVMISSGDHQDNVSTNN